jgi:iron-sulfur cluster assembly protein
VSDFPLEFTDIAREKLKEAMAEQDEGVFIRAAIQGGGCSGLQYKLDVDSEHFDHDYIHEEEGLKIVVDGYSAVYLEGTVLDYESALHGAGFKFVNPNAKKTCGCGSSFGY